MVLLIGALIGLVLGLTGAGGSVMAVPLLMGGLGLVGGILAQKFDQMAAISNFIVTPLSFLSGTFYSIQALPPFFRAISHANPIFYLIDGARDGFTGVSDSSPLLGFSVCLAAVLVVCTLAWWLLRTGYRLKP